MTEMEAEALFGALASTARLAVVRHLVQAGPEGASAGAIAEALQATPSRTSFHLASLSEVGLIQSERRARHKIYTVDFGRIGALAAFLLHDCCRGHPAAQACCPPVSRGEDLDRDQSP